MNDDLISPRPAAGPAATSMWRFGSAFSLAVIASVWLPFVATPIIINATGAREAGMAMGVPLGVIAGWFFFPFIAWRPFRAVHLLAIPIGVLAALAGLIVLPEHWLTSHDADRNGVFGAMINMGLCSLFAYGALTWSRNMLVRRRADSSRKGLGSGM